MLSKSLILRIIPLALLWGTSIITTHASDNPELFYHFDSEQNQLSHNGVLSLLEDSRGYIWVGTMMGLNRFDGKNMRKFFSEELPSDYILSLCEDKRGNIWIGTSEGMACYLYRESDIVKIPFEFNEAPRFVNSIACNSKGEIWFDTGGSSLYSIVGPTSEIVEHAFNLPDCSKRLCFNDVDKLVVNCNGHGIFMLEEDALSPLLDTWMEKDYFDKDEINNPVFSTRSNDIFYIASKRRGLCEVNLLTKTITVLHKWTQAQKPVNLYSDGNETLYVSTSSGLVIYDLWSKTVKVLSHSSYDPRSLSGNYLTASLVDSRGGMWVGTREYGLNYSFKEELFHKVCYLSSGHSLNGCMVRAMSEDYNGDIWIATERSGLLKYDPQTDVLLRMYENTLPFFITTVLCDEDIVWCGTQNGIIGIDKRRNSVKHYYADNDAQQENRVLSLYKSSKSGILAGCTSGVLKFDPDSRTFKPLSALAGISVENFAEDLNGRIWMATYSDGVLAWDPYMSEGIRRYGSQTSTMVSSVFIDRSQNVWAVGNGAELAVYDRMSDTFRRFGNNVLSGAPEASYISAVQDSDGYIWISTTSGLFRIDPQSLSVRHFTTDNGLLNNSFGRASLRTVSGSLGFGSLDGFIFLKPQINKVIGNPPPHTDIVSIEAEGRNLSLPIENGINLRGKIGSLKFTFATPGCVGSSAIYARLTPIESLAQDVSNNMSVSYANLRPGTYTLELTSHAPIKIKIHPPFLLSAAGVMLLSFAFICAFILVYLLASYFAKRNQERKEERKRFERESALMQDKMSFLTNVVHEIKTPLTMIKTPLNNLLASNASNPKVLDSLHVISNGVSTLDNLSKDLLSFIRVERCTYKVDMKVLDACEMINLLSFNFGEIIKDRNLRFVADNLPEHLYVNADSKSLNTILSNLIGNAVKYSESWIKVTAKEDNGKAIISIINDGPEIPENLRDEIFKPFVSFDSGNDAYKHSFGIGLPFSLKLAQLQNGTLELVHGQNIEFRLTLDSAMNMLPESVSKQSELFLEDRPTILLIEDNIQLCDYLSGKLSEEYNVLSALSAERGFSILSSKAVDLIVTDLNMPGIGGEELCRRISMDFETSHIPVIVISALTDEDMKLKCIANGADAFIEKPFTVEYLKANMASILEKMHKMRASTQKDVSGRFNLSRFGIRDRDEEFLKRISAAVDKHLDDSTFTVKQLEDELSISHSSLNRKLTGLLKISPIEFIRMRRLVAAAKILEDGNTNVSEVAYMVGFTTPSYFSKCFRKQFGLTPKEFVDGKM